MTARDRAVGDVMPRQVTPRFKAPKVAKKKRKPKSPLAQADTLWGAIIHLREDRCQFCGKRDGKMDAHHVLLRRFKATRTDTTNGVLVCFRCHQDVAHGDSWEAVKHYERILGHETYQALRDRAKAGVGAKYPESFWRERVAALELELAQEGLRHG